MQFKWSGIEEFVKVAELGSFSKAADNMNVSKSHISKHIKMLERECGVILFHRTTRSVSLTNQGRDFFLKCQKILANLEEARAELVDEASELAGPIKMAVAGAFGEDFIAPVVSSFLEEYPDVSINMEFTNRLVNIQEEHFDLAIRSEFADLDNFITEKICQFDLVTVARPDYLESNPTIKVPDDLEEHNCLVGTVPYWRFRINDQIRQVIIEGNWRSNNGRALIRAVNSGMGVAQLPLFYVAKELERGALTAVLEDYAIKEINYYAVMSKLRFVPRRVSMLIKHLQQKLPSNVRASMNGVL